ncbi:MAG: polyphosphate kinase [[Chlorobium] sp. 445]|nr:MAG: polyphosphate kinase [[Chlorobium] sp. 445]
MNIKKFLAPKKVNLSKIRPDDTGKIRTPDEIRTDMEHDLKMLYDLHYLMYADNKRALLIILQGIDASGKDGTAKHLFAGFNPQGCRLYSFKKPSEAELEHDFLWRTHRVMPARGGITIFNRSYYEEISTVKVHPEYLLHQNLPDEILHDPEIFRKRVKQINAFEKMLFQNGMHILKFFLHISKDEQRIRLQERLNDPTKHWKFSMADLEERKLWDNYMRAFEEMLEQTNTKYAPWYVIPADKKWYRNYLVARIVVETLSKLNMAFPKASVPDGLNIV